MRQSRVAVGAGADQRAALFEALLRLILQRGLDRPRKLTVEELAERVEVSPSTFFRLGKSIDQLVEDFWPWCWDQLNAYLADRVFTNPERGDALTMLMRETDYLWDLRDDDHMRGIVFLCFLYYRRASELGDGKSSEPQRRFEGRIGKLCDAVVEERGSGEPTQAMTLQLMVMTWIATVFMAWQQVPASLDAVTTDHARLGLRSVVSTVLAGTDAVTEPDSSVS